MFISGLLVDISHVPPIDPPPPGTGLFPVYQGATLTAEKSLAAFN